MENIVVGDVPDLPLNEMASALDLTKARIFQLRREGMPMHSVAAAKEWRAKRPRSGIASAGDAREVSCSTPEPVPSNRPTAAAAPPAFSPVASGTPLQGWSLCITVCLAKSTCLTQSLQAI